MYDQVVAIIKKGGARWLSSLKKTNNYYEYFIIHQSYLDEIEDVCMNFKKICFLENRQSLPLCPVCGNKIKKYRKALLVFYNFCSDDCRYSNKGKKITYAKIKQTTKARFGVDHVMKRKDIVKKTQDTNVERYGCTCTAQNKEIKEKIKKTNLERYGVEKIFDSEEIQNKAKNTIKKKYGSHSKMMKMKSRADKAKQTNIEKYGVEYVTQNEEIKEKTKQTNLEKYGVECTLQNEEIKEKTKQTNLEKYGAEHPMQGDIVPEKIKKTNLEKYGSENVFGSEEIQKKSKQTNFEKYGVEYTLQNKNIREQIKQTNLEKYGFEVASKNKIIADKIKCSGRLSYKDVFFNSLKNKSLEMIGGYDKYINANVGEIIKFKCLDCGHIFDYELTKLGFSIITIYCHQCYVKNHGSKPEKEIYDFIKSLGINVIHNKYFIKGKEKYELDIYLPDYNFGIEFDGLYWHSDLFKSSDYHINKTNFFKDIFNIDIIHIFENEWENSKNIVQSILRNRLNKSENRYYARKCKIDVVNDKDYKLFCRKYHLQGWRPANYVYGLYNDNNELIQIMAFGLSRYNKNYDYEIIRSATIFNTAVVGGFSKLLNYALTRIRGKIISYVDLRYFTGSGYLKSDFIYLGNSQPNYYYYLRNDYRLYSRLKFQKHKLKNILELYDENLSEYENMINNDYFRIFDCGNAVFIYESK